MWGADPLKPAVTSAQCTHRPTFLSFDRGELLLHRQQNYTDVQAAGLLLYRQQQLYVDPLVARVVNLNQA